MKNITDYINESEFDDINDVNLSVGHDEASTSTYKKLKKYFKGKLIFSPDSDWSDEENNLTHKLNSLEPVKEWTDKNSTSFSIFKYNGHYVCWSEDDMMTQCLIYEPTLKLK